MPSFSESDRPSDEFDEETRRKQRELSESEAKEARCLRVRNVLRAMQVGIAVAGAETGNPAYRSAGMVVQWVIDRIEDSE